MSRDPLRTSSSPAGASRPPGTSWSSEVTRALRESLEGYCTGEICDRIVAAALTRAGLLAPPETGAELSAFVTESLSPEIQNRLGDDAATEVEQRMAMVIHVLSRATRAVPITDSFDDEPPSAERPVTARPPEPPELVLFVEEDEPASDDVPTAPPPPLETRTPTVRPAEPHAETQRPGPSADPTGAITVSTDSVRNVALALVSPDSKLAGRVQLVLGDGGTAIGYRTLADLAKAPAGLHDVILVDRRGSAPSATLALPEIVRGAMVFLWPAKPEAAAALQKTATHVAGVSAYGADVTIDDVVVLVRLAAGRRAR